MSSIGNIEIIPASEASARKLLGKVDKLVRIRNVQWAIAGNVRWMI